MRRPCLVLQASALRTHRESNLRGNNRVERYTQAVQDAKSNAGGQNSATKVLNEGMLLEALGPKVRKEVTHSHESAGRNSWAASIAVCQYQLHSLTARSNSRPAILQCFLILTALKDLKALVHVEGA